MRHKKGNVWTEDKKHTKALSEEEEKIAVLGQESDTKAVKWVQEEVNEQEKQQKKEKEAQLDTLDSLARKKKEAYLKTLQFFLHDIMKEIEFPKKWQWGVLFDGKGIVALMRDHNLHLHKRAFRVSFEPKYDLHAVMVLGQWAETVYDAYATDTKPTNGSQTSETEELWLPKSVQKTPKTSPKPKKKR